LVQIPAGKSTENNLSEILEDPTIRRSKRMANQRNGFRDPLCTRKDYLGCTVTPPTLSASVIRNLGASFCNLEEDKLTNTVLSKKKLASTPRGKKPAKKKPTNKDDADDKQSQK